MKKIAFVMIIAALCMSPVIASADGNGWRKFHGTYEMISSGICLHSVDGWVASNPALPSAGGDGFVGFKPVDASKVWAGTATARATWIFNRGGTGTVQGTNYASIFPGSDVKAPYESQSAFGFTFNYEITNNGVVTVTGTSGSANGIVMNGMISIDKKIMTLLSAAQIQNFTGVGLGFLINNNMRILIKVGN